MTTSAPKLITYTYPQSPYAFKIHSILSILSQKTYQNVPVSRVLPRPELTSIGVSYRRIPVLAAGKDVYCDSQAIIDFLLTLPGATDAKVLGIESANFGFKILGDTIFRTGLQAIPTAALTPEFVADRKPIFGLLQNPELQSGALRPHGLGELRSLLERIENETLRDVKGGFLAGGDKPSLSDAHFAWAVRFTLIGLGAGQEAGFGKEDLPILWEWLERFIAATEFELREISADDAAKEILGAADVSLGESLKADPTDLQLGDAVSVFQTDNDDKEHPVTGKLVRLARDEVVVQVKTGVRVHLPRLGQRIKKAD